MGQGVCPTRFIGTDRITRNHEPLIVQSYSADRLPQTDTTMLFILLACAGIPGCGVATWLMGVIGNQSGGLAKAFYLVPACYLILALLIGYDWFTQRTSRSPAEAEPALSPDQQPI